MLLCFVDIVPQVQSVTLASLLEITLFTRLSVQNTLLWPPKSYDLSFLTRTMLEGLLSVSLGNILPLGASLYVLVCLAQCLIDPLRNVPGPLLARFTRLWYLYKIYKGDFERMNIELHKKYGPVVRIAPNEYSIDDVEAARVIYGHGNAFVKVGGHSQLLRS